MGAVDSVSAAADVIPPWVRTEDYGLNCSARGASEAGCETMR